LATNLDKSFEVQAFQCPFGNSKASVFAGFAMKVDGKHTVTIIGDKVGIDGSSVTTHAGQFGLDIDGTPAKTIALSSSDKCARFNTKIVKHSRKPGYYHNMNIQIANAAVAYEGVCGGTDRKPVVGTESLFSASELQQLCSLCGQSPSCVKPPTGGNDLILDVAGGWTPPANSKEACATAVPKADYAKAQDLCKEIKEDAAFYEACLFDYCVTGGDTSVVQNAIDSKKADKATIDLKSDLVCNFRALESSSTSLEDSEKGMKCGAKPIITFEGHKCWNLDSTFLEYASGPRQTVGQFYTHAVWVYWRPSDNG
jgi:hypothetical protein